MRKPHSDDFVDKVGLAGRDSCDDQMGGTSSDAPRAKTRRDRDVVIIGGGPAGLTAAYELCKQSARHNPIVLEASDKMGGIARTETYKGFRFDIGGHRFFTKVGEVDALWHEICGADFLLRPRLSRIYYRGKYFAYPLKIGNALWNMGIYETVRIALSYLKWKVRPFQNERNLQQWVINRFGGRLFQHFFRTYTEKVWGLRCHEISADWAAQRIQNLSLSKAVINALGGANNTASLIERFHYPRLGPGMMWEHCRDRILEAGGDVRTGATVTRLHHERGRVSSVAVEDGEGTRRRLTGDSFISSMALRELVHAMDPPAPQHVREAADELKYRDFVIVTLILDHADPFPDNWIYVHSPDVQVGRIQNFRAWSEEMVPTRDRASIGMEYFCDIGSELWDMDDADLIALATQELAQLKLAPAGSVIDGTVIRQPKAYPVYDDGYRKAVNTIREWLDGFDNLQVVGRNGMHRYNNQDHSMLTAMLAARNVLGEAHDLWEVNVERSYHEEFQVEKSARPAPKAAMAGA
ncbi:MAG: NAD(P)/FAD-dependent oxidoreductase [Novosphingobium sp.]